MKNPEVTGDSLVEAITTQFDPEGGACSRGFPGEKITAEARGQMAQSVSLKEWFGEDVCGGRHLNRNLR